MEFYEVEIPLHLQPSLVLKVETEELGIVAGLQDRVIQVYGGLVYMDFGEDVMRRDEASGLQYGLYTRLEPSLLPPLYIAFSDDVGEPTEVLHNPLRARYEAGDQAVVAAMEQFANLTSEAKQALEQGDADRLSGLIDKNFDIRRRTCKLHDKHIAMIETARKIGVSAKFAGSGGAIIGVCQDDATLERLKQALKKTNCRVFRPDVG